MAVKITQNGVTKTLPEAHEIDARIKKLIKDNSEIFVYETFEKFPSSGLSNLLYKAEDTNILYSWNKTTKQYNPISGSGELPQIKVIFGGTAQQTEEATN